MNVPFTAQLSSNPNRTRLLALAAFAAVLAVPTASTAQWLRHNNVTTGTALSGVFPGASGAYAGVVTSTASNLQDGSTNGVPGISPGGHPISGLTSSFYTYGYSPNAGTGLDSLACQYNDGGDTYTVTMDFTGLANGYLPSGTVVALLDIDISEDLRTMQIYNPGTGSFTPTPILTPLAGSQFNPGPGYFDYNNSGGDLSATIGGPTVSGPISWIGDPNQYDSLFLGYVTNQDVYKLRFDFAKNYNTGIGGGGYGLAFRANPVPEPSTVVAILTGASGILACRRRARKRNTTR